MFMILVRKYIKNYEDTTDSNVREQYGTLCSILSIVCNMIMVIFKIFVGYITHSVAILADGFNNLSDMGSNLATMFGFKLANKHPDSEHPYGYGRYEYITGLIISFLICLVALSSIKESVMKIIHPEKIHFTITAVIVLVVSIAIKLWMASFNKKAGEIIKSPSLNAAAQDSLNDVLTTAASLVSLFVSLFTDLPVDGLIGLGVSLIILKSVVEIFKDTVDPLLGQTPDPELVKDLYKFILSFDKVLGIHDFMMHDYGPGRKYLSFHAEVNSSENIMEIHDEIDAIEVAIMLKFGILTTIHMDPLDVDNAITQSLKNQVAEVVASINPLYSIHDFRSVSGPTHVNLIFDVLLPRGEQVSYSEFKMMINEKIQQALGPNYFCVIQVDHSYI